jgi:ZIP family zinc transporter
VNVWDALLWGGLTSASLYIGQALAGPMSKSDRITGLVMGFGAGTMLSAVGYELIPESSFDQGLGILLGFLTGALVYFFADASIDRRGGEQRQDLDADDTPAANGSGAAMFVGALLDGVPEAFVLGISLAFGGSISIGFVAAVFISNIPQGGGRHDRPQDGRQHRPPYLLDVDRPDGGRGHLSWTRVSLGRFAPP